MTLHSTTAGKLTSGASPEVVAQELAPLVDFQAEGLGWDALQQMMQTRLAPHLMRYDHPGFHSMFNAVPEVAARQAATWALEYNQGVTNWQVSPGGAMLEELCCRALCRLFNWPAQADATFMYSGTYANQEAIYLALCRAAEQQGFSLAEKGISGFADPARLVVLCSADAHFSIRHAVRMLGLGEASLHTVTVDAQRRMDVAALQKQIEKLRHDHTLVAVVATAGTTSTGSVDRIDLIADICQQAGVWLHVDSAYGYAYRLVPEWADIFAGCEAADSLTWDPHKQLGIPIPNSLLFVRRRTDFAYMALHSGYFNRSDDVEPNPGLKSPPSTRPLSALPLVASLRCLGMQKVIAHLRAPLVAICSLAEALQTQGDLQLAHWPDTGILCFRFAPSALLPTELDDHQVAIYQQCMAEGHYAIARTTLDEQVYLRLVVVSPETTVADLLETVDYLRGLSKSLSGIV